MFRNLGRKNKEISSDECVEILTVQTRGVLAVNGDDGYPYATPMNHFYNASDGCIYFHCGRGGHRLDALSRSDKVSFCVCEQGVRDDGDWAYNVRSVIVFGRITAIDDIEVIKDIAKRLSYKFTQDEQYVQNEIERFLDKTVLLKLTPEHICGKRVKEC